MVRSYVEKVRIPVKRFLFSVFFVCFLDFNSPESEKYIDYM